MKAVGLALFGWLVPGGAYLLMRRYLQFAFFAVLVSATFAVGLALDGGLQWPLPADLRGLDPATELIFKGGALAKLLAGCPYLFASFFANTHSFLDGRVHEYGSTLLVLAGLFNLLAVSNALELRKAED
jgi:hypothetical protein